MRPRILIGALSGKKHHQRRAVCRETWIGEANRSPNVQALFLIGAGDAVAAPVQLDDLLLFPCPDAYETLPQRTRWFCRWALARDDWDWLFKCDDDTYVAVERLLQYDLAGKDYIGAEWTPGVCYASGGAGYFLSRRAAAIVAEQLTAATGAEDAEVGKVLRRAGIELVHDDCFIPFGRDREPPRPENDTITTHGIPVDTFLQIHHDLARQWRFRIAMPTSNAYATNVLHATLHLLDEFWPGHPPVDVLHHEQRPQVRANVKRFCMGRQDETAWTDGLARYLERYNTDDLVLLMLDDYGLCGPPRIDAILDAQRAALADPSIANVHLTWQPAQPKTRYGRLLRLPAWSYSVNTQAALWRRDQLLAAAQAQRDASIEEFELAGSRWFNESQSDACAHCQVPIPEPRIPSACVDDTDKSQWALPYHNLMHRGRPSQRHRDFLASHRLAWPS